ncbi:hypothetical protein [Puerhibacterium puerhi]|uniref:hypothetical protein n=1 Tax=Puerhibacterium puerhi TaxID=2692623 RepID=UPI0013573967|nr:hypothetical protein [Puerhibacterium puerhi]
MTADSGRVRLPWVLEGHQEGFAFVRSPDATHEQARAAVERIGAGMADAERSRPAVLRAIERAGRWWYPVGMAVGVLVLLLLTGRPFGSLVVGLVGGGVLAAVVRGVVRGSAARARRGRLGALLDRESRTVAPASPHAVHVAATVVELEPQLEERAHVLAYAASLELAADAGGQERAEELDRLYGEVLSRHPKDPRHRRHVDDEAHMARLVAQAERRRAGGRTPRRTGR